MNKIQRQVVKLAYEILAGQEFQDLVPLSHHEVKLLNPQRLTRCNAGSFIPPNHVCYGNHDDNPKCKDCARKS